MSSTVIELWGGLHDGKRVAVRGSRGELPATYHIDEPAPIRAQADAAAKPTNPGKHRYTYVRDAKSKRNLYRYGGYEEIKP
jgi:hypothetical protein